MSSSSRLGWRKIVDTAPSLSRSSDSVMSYNPWKMQGYPVGFIGLSRSHGVDDGFRISSHPSDHQQDPALPCADGGKIEQIARKSATGCNRDLNDQEGLAPDESGETGKR
jgi:hypothetical protein